MFDHLKMGGKKIGNKKNCQKLLTDKSIQDCLDLFFIIQKLDFFVNVYLSGFN